IYKSAGTPCGAAHSMARALYSSYSGPLYQVQKASDKSTKDIMVGTDGFAKSSDQDSFCSGTTCTIPIIYDQSGNENHLRVTFWAYWLMSGGNPATANAAKISVGGHTVYGIKSGSNVAYHSGVQLAGTASVTKGSSTVTFSSPQTLPANSVLLFVDNTKDCPMNSYPNNCYYKRNFTAAAINAATTVTLTANYVGSSYPATRVYDGTTRGIAVDDEAEAEYAIFDGKSYGTLCCFDYGAAEMTGFDEGNATMEAISWGATTQFGQSGGGSGPWISADIENGMYEGYENGSAKVASNTSITGWPYVTAMLKGLSAKDCPSGLTSSGCFALKAANSQSGSLEWKWNATTKNYGARPPGYSPQKKQGAIILGTGGDGSNTGVGIWFEGAMTKGAPPDATDDAIQANIVAAGFGK
ncbi:MAG TPA: arabinofuranosidase catalytic domain-containing protein, partial [Polyangia bacterium]